MSVSTQMLLTSVLMVYSICCLHVAVQSDLTIDLCLQRPPILGKFAKSGALSRAKIGVAVQMTMNITRVLYNINFS